MDDLTIRLRAKLDETERLARACDAMDWRSPVEGSIVDRDTDGWQGAPDEALIFSYGTYDRQAEAEHALAHDPDATLRMVAAHRKIIDGYEQLTHNRERLTDAALHLQWNVVGRIVRIIAEGYGIDPLAVADSPEVQRRRAAADQG